MKTPLAFLFGILCAISLHAATNAAPEMTIRYALDKDLRTWTIADAFTNMPAIFTREWVPKGDSIDAWKDMFDEKVIVTKSSIREHLDAWKSFLARADPKADVKEEKNADGGITITYTSPGGNEMGVSRYMKAPDGLYILSYRVRPQLKNEATLKIWRDIIAAASLSPSNGKSWPTMKATAP